MVTIEEKWLNGWTRLGFTGVLMGTSVHCVGCGKFEGTTCVSGHGWIPQKRPDWPFKEGSCPVCYLQTLRGK